MAQEVAGENPRPQDLLMTLLGAYVHPRTRAVWSGGLVTLLEGFGVTPGAARVALTRLAARDMLTRTKNGRRAHYTITPRAAAILREGDGRIFSLGVQADGEGPDAAKACWTVLWHTIPESRRVERTRLTRRLRFLGFGPVQDGTWLAPQDREREVVGLLEELGVREHAGMMLGAPAGSLDVRAFVNRVWDLEELGRRYRAFVDTYGPYIQDTGDTRDIGEASPSDLDDRGALMLRTRLLHSFRQFPFLDPELPENLVPAPPDRSEAVRVFHDLSTALAPAAQRHFDEVTTP